ncbi:hypothetical protein [Microbulbifer sp. ARAS458-1]|uniref:hypothetical protein n=1 Tax=Microbulbifer sp. ARAS458-1 TaxID=3140242 RepID=UPI003877E716
MQKYSKDRGERMLTTVDILDMLKHKLGSDYRTAKVLDISTQRISQLRNKGGSFTDEQSLKIAEILEVPGETIILSMVAERSTKSPAFDLLRRLAESHTPKIYAAASAVVVAILANLPSPAVFPLI